MRTFKDNKGRDWTISIDVAAVRRVRAELNVNLVGSDVVNVLSEVLTDPLRLCEVVYVLCRPDAEKAGISREDFEQSMFGDALEIATRAFSDEVANFTPNPRDRTRALRVVETMFTMMEKARNLEETRFEKKIGELENTPMPISGPSSSSSPEPSASTPTP